jgi:hypothetical protein
MVPSLDASMSLSLEDRVRELEQFRFAATARINALQTAAVSALTILALDLEDPFPFAENLTRAWARGAEAVVAVPGADPAQLDMLAQEFQDAIARLSAVFLQTVRNEFAKQQKLRPGA